MTKPKVEKPAQTAKTPDRKNEENKKEKKKASSQNEFDFNADEIAALLNKTEPTNGGAKSGKTEKAFGAIEDDRATRLSQNEMDALRGQIQKNWSSFAGIEGLDGMILTVSFELDPHGNIVGQPEVETTGGSEAARPDNGRQCAPRHPEVATFRRPAGGQDTIMERDGRQLRPELHVDPVTNE